MFVLAGGANYFNESVLYLERLRLFTIKTWKWSFKEQVHMKSVFKFMFFVFGFH